MSEWLKEHAWKACVGETLPWVRIPLSPPTFAKHSLRSRLRLASPVKHSLRSRLRLAGRVKRAITKLSAEVLAKADVQCCQSPLDISSDWRMKAFPRISVVRASCPAGTR